VINTTSVNIVRDGLRNQIWAKLCDIKYRAIYTSDCETRFSFYENAYELLIALFTTSTIVGWSVWQQLPLLWGGIVGAMQVLQVVRRFIPYFKSNKERLEASVQFEALYGKYKRLMNDIDYHGLSESKVEDRLEALQTAEQKIESKYRKAHCPDVQKWKDKALAETEQVLNIDFPGGN